MLRLTTSLTIYRLGLRGNNAHKSTRKHRFWTRKPLKSPEITQKIYAYAFGTLRLQDRIFFLKTHQKSLETSEFQGFSIFFKKTPKMRFDHMFWPLMKRWVFKSNSGISLRLKKQSLLCLLRIKFCVVKQRIWLIFQGILNYLWKNKLVHGYTVLKKMKVWSMQNTAFDHTFEHLRICTTWKLYQQ